MAASPAEVGSLFSLATRRVRVRTVRFRYPEDMTAANRQILLAARPTGFPKPTDFRMVETPVPEPADGQFLVGIAYLSVDPYMRGRMNAARSYADPQPLDEVMGGGAVGKVLASRHPGFAEGEYVVGFFGWQEYAISDGSGVMKVDPRMGRSRRRSGFSVCPA